MIHTKSLIRRLAYVPWLLAFGLVLGWAGEAQAQEIRLSANVSEIREDGGAVTITVTAKTFNAVGDAGVHEALGVDRVVQLMASAPFNLVDGADAGTEGDEVDGFGRRFTMTLPSIVIPKDAKEVSVDAVFTPIPTNHENDETVTTGDNPYKEEDRIPNEDLVVYLSGSAGSATPVDKDGSEMDNSDTIMITMIDTDKPSYNITLSLDPASVSKEAQETNVTVSGRLDGAKVNNKTLSALLRQTGGTAGRDADYDIELSTLTIARKKPNGSTTIQVTPKNAGIGTIVIGSDSEAKLMVAGVDINQDGDTRDEWPAETGGKESASFDILAAGLNDSTEFMEDVVVARAMMYHVASGDSTYYWSEAAANDDDGFDLNGDGDTVDFLTVVKEKDVQRYLQIVPATFEIKDTAIAATKGLTADPAEIRESVVGQDEPSREVSVKLDIEIANELPDDARVRFFVRDELGNLEDDFIADAEAATRGTDYTATVDDLVIPAGATKGSTTLNLTVFDNTGKNAAKIIRVEARVGSVSKFVGIKITDDETATTNVTLSVDPGEVKVTDGESSETVTVTGTLNGNVFEDDTKVTLVINPSGENAAQRDTDYRAVLRSLTIEAGETSGSVDIEITARNGGDKKVWLKSLADEVRKNDEDDPVGAKQVAITLKDADAVPEGEDPGALSFEDDLSSTVFDGIVGTALDTLKLPAAMGGDGDRTYSVSNNLPAGLDFDADELTITGTPTTAGESTVVFTVIDDSGSAATTFTIDIAEMPEPMAEVASVSLTQSSIRENGETASISVTATLAKASPVAGVVTFTLGNATGDAALDAAAIRDVDYTASLLASVAVDSGATSATSTLVVTPINNDETDGDRSFGVHASAAGGSASANFTIADDETASTSISLSANPHTVSEGSGVTVITITATLNGKVLDEEALVTVSVDPSSTAQRDVDYAALFDPLLKIPAGEVSGSITMHIDPTSDEKDEGNQTITLLGTIEGLDDGKGQIIIADAAMDEEEMMDPLVFAEGTMIADIGVTAGSPMSATELPEASGGEGDITYSVEGLPEGLSLDGRTLSGQTDAEGSYTVTYTATAGDESVSLTFTVTVNSELSFGDLFGVLNDGAGKDGKAGKANPADSHIDEAGILQIIVGQPYSLTLPSVEGGTPPYTYELTGLPAGLSFDSDSRTVSGTAKELSDTFALTYKVTDGSGASRSQPILAVVIHPPLDAPDALVAEDYKGADGAGDQGGFVLLTWDLSEHHDGIDGYRIFRELPVLGNEMVPWAIVDAVPGVSIGRAIVATLDNVATNWGIAAERGGQTTHGAAKAVFVSAENLNHPYEQMAATMMASREAAQAGDAPVFASLLPEALDFAQGVAPKLNLVAGVLSSAVTVTEEPARGIDNIAPLAVPSFSVLDAPNDQGSRIVLTWTLSPSDQLLQDVVAGVVGPAQVEPVVGVYGYNIYRSAAGEDEFAQVGQVEAGVTSFVDETALNGVRYTYEVRPYDLDNETDSELEQTAMAVRNLAVDSEGRTLFGLFGADNSIGFDDFFIFADNFGLTVEDTGFDPAFDLAPNATIDFDDFFVFADNFGRSTAAAGKIVPMLAGLNADARMYLDARTAMPVVGEDFVLDVRLADFAAIKGYGLQVQYDASQLEFVEVLTDQPLGGGEFATPQVLSNETGVLAVAALGDVVADGEVALSLVFRAPTEIENTVIELIDNQTYDSDFGFNTLALPAPVQLQTRPEAFALANNYPNPFNPATTIKYALPQAADVELTVYNVLGQPIRTLVTEHQSAGRYVVEWDATNDNGHRLASGMYFYRLEAGGEFREIKKMLLLK